MAVILAKMNPQQSTDMNNARSVAVSPNENVPSTIFPIAWRVCHIAPIPPNKATPVAACKARVFVSGFTMANRPHPAITTPINAGIRVIRYSRGSCTSPFAGGVESFDWLKNPFKPSPNRASPHIRATYFNVRLRGLGKINGGKPTNSLAGTD